MIKNKARLVAQRHTQEEGIDYDEVFAPVPRIEAIRLFMAYASFKDFIVYQMYVNSAFIYGKIEKEVYVYQPLGFEDLDFLDKVYKLEKALYGLHHAPRAWNKKDERGIMIKNKARLVAQRHTQEEGIDYDEVFAPVPRIEAIRLFMAYASFKDFIVYQMYVNSAFIYGKIEKEVYVYQPLGFEDLDFLDKVYKLEKALYGLHHAPRAWEIPCSTHYFESNNLPRSEFIVTLLREIIEIAIFDLEPLSLSFDFVISYEIFKSLSFSLD
nr:putative ribonuclease H-like domain-containing protein [Tanacetum cinerariifolium]